MTTAIARPDLRAMVDDWASRLRLRDWRIAIAYVADLTDSAGHPAYGLCSRLVDNKTATIKIRDPRSHTAVAPGPSIEETVVHELLHLAIAPLSDDSPASIAAEEQAVWSIAPLVVAAKGTGKEHTIARAMLAPPSPAKPPQSRTPRLPPAQHAELLRRMGTGPAPSVPRRQGRNLVFSTRN